VSLILGIESSCDETAVAILKNKEILASVVASQDDVHERFGGVVPELASRRHLEMMVPLLHAALEASKIDMDEINGIAVTSAPGLVVSLLVGISAAKGLAYALNKPIVGVNHLEGHLNAVHLEYEDVPYPHIGLVVSGGHTSLYLVKDFGEYELLGATRDDAAGEAYDKVAKLMELGYPGGPIIDKLAHEGDAKAFKFTVPKFEQETLDFSFSGIKTAVLLKHRDASKKGKVDDKFVRDIAASFQYTVVKILCDRLFEAAAKHGARAVVISGGVAANKGLREELKRRSEELKIKSFIPSIKLCTDNAAMIAYVGRRYLESGQFSDMKLNAVANQEIGVDRGPRTEDRF
jgi:N6-L-threonylcarbamoyladenine synthase